MFIEAARARGEALDHVLLAGPARPGQDLARADRGQRARAPSSWPRPGPALERKGDVASYLSSLEPRSVFFVDEIHRLPRALEETFYPAMEDRRLPITVGQGAGARVVNLDLPAVHPDRRHHPRRAAHHAAARPLRGDPPARAVRARRSWARIVRRSAGDPRAWRSTPTAPRPSPRARAARPRVANRLLKRVRDFAEVRGAGAIDAAVAAEALDLLEVDAPRPRPPGPRDPARDLREVRRRPGRPVHAGRRGGGGAGHGRGRLRAVPAPAGPDHAHPAGARGHRRRPTRTWAWRPAADRARQPVLGARLPTCAEPAG